MHPELHREQENLILSSLSEAVSRQVEPHLESVEMPLTKILYLPKQKVDYIYFPDTSVISIVTMLESGDGVESGIIGREGVCGANLIFADEISPAEATVQLGGDGRRMKITKFRELFDGEKEFRDKMLYYIYSYIAQISQNSACLSHHNIEKRLARWLLMFDDRKGGNQLVLTQEFIAQMLGVRRPSVSMNAKKLQERGLISYNRGVVTILDRVNLIRLACECYEEINNSLYGFSDRS